MAEEKKLIEPITFKSPFIKDPDDKPLIRPIQYEDREKSIEAKIYIILYQINNAEDDISSRTFSICTGRTAAYYDIKEKLQSGVDIDVHRSYIITETKQTETSTGDIRYFMVPFKDMISVYAFCISNSDYFGDEGFDIEEYAEGDIPENVYDITNSVLTQEQLEYRIALEGSLQRDKFINDMRDVYGTNV